MMPSKLFKIYLSDHAAMIAVNREVAKRCLSNNREGPLADSLIKLIAGLELEADALDRVVGAAGVSKSQLKVAAVWAAEKLGRLKLNGRVIGYSDLSRLLELEGLLMLADGRASLWRSLQEVSDAHGYLDPEELADLAARADAQRAEMAEHRQGAARTALVPEDAL